MKDEFPRHRLSRATHAVERDPRLDCDRARQGAAGVRSRASASWSATPARKRVAIEDVLDVSAHRERQLRLDLSEVVPRRRRARRPDAVRPAAPPRTSRSRWRSGPYHVPRRRSAHAAGRLEPPPNAIVHPCGMVTSRFGEGHRGGGGGTRRRRRRGHRGALPPARVRAVPAAGRVDHAPARRSRPGLAIVKQIIDAHGGTIGVTSEGPGKGATFTVVSLIAPAVVPKRHASRLRAAARGRRRHVRGREGPSWSTMTTTRAAPGAHPHGARRLGGGGRLGERGLKEVERFRPPSS